MFQLQVARLTFPTVCSENSLVSAHRKLNVWPPPGFPLPLAASGLRTWAPPGFAPLPRLPTPQPVPRAVHSGGRLTALPAEANNREGDKQQGFPRDTLPGSEVIVSFSLFLSEMNAGNFLAQKCAHWEE